MEMTIERELEVAALGHDTTGRDASYCGKCHLFTVCNCGACDVCLGLPCAGDTPPRKIPTHELEVRAKILDLIRDNRHEAPDEWEFHSDTGSSSERHPEAEDAFTVNTPCCDQWAGYRFKEDGSLVILKGVKGYPRASDKGEICPSVVTKQVRTEKAVSRRLEATPLKAKAIEIVEENEDSYRGSACDVLLDIAADAGHDDVTYEGLGYKDMPFAKCHSCDKTIGPLGCAIKVRMQQVKSDDDDDDWVAFAPIDVCVREYRVVVTYTSVTHYEGTTFVEAESEEDAIAKARQEFEDGEIDCEFVDEGPSENLGFDVEG